MLVNSLLIKQPLLLFYDVNAKGESYNTLAITLAIEVLSHSALKKKKKKYTIMYITFKYSALHYVGFILSLVGFFLID